MNLKSLLLCSDEKIVRVLRRTLGDLDIGVELCADAGAALRKLTRERFEAIIVDCGGPGAAAVLRSTRTAPCNKRAIAVAILDPEIGLRSAFDLGAHFILYKPVSVEKSKSSFRAARALMKKERRRNERIPINIAVEMYSRDSGTRIKANTIDLGEGGLALNMPRRSKPQGRWNVTFTLPGSETSVEMEAQFAWEGTRTQVGLRFENQSPEMARQLREWLGKNAPDVEKDDPPAVCQLTHLSLGGCYLELPSPFPASTRVTLSMRAADMELKTEGVVRVMHADKGMGVEFTRTTPEHRTLLENFLALLAENRDLQPELLVEPEGLEIETWSTAPVVDDQDVLLALFRNQAGLPAEAFLEKLGKQWKDSASVGASA